MDGRRRCPGPSGCSPTSVNGSCPASIGDGLAKVLYVEDETALHEVTKAFLEMENDIVVDTVSNAHEGLQRVRRKDYDVIVSDYQMSEVNGLQFLKLLRSEGNDIPFILFTGKGREEVAIEALNSGADFYVQKGGDPKIQFGELRHIVIKLAQKRRTELALREREERLQLLTDNMRDIIIQMSTDGTIQYVSPSVLPTFGYQPEELVGRGAEDMVHPDDLYKFKEFIERGPENGSPLKTVYRIRHADGHFIWMEVMGNFLFDPNGTAIGSMIISRDVTERMRAQQELETSERKYRELVEKASSIIVRMDRQGRISYMNDYAFRFFGYAPEEILSKRPVGTILPIQEVNDGFMQQAIGDTMTVPDRMFLNINEHIKKNGEKVWVAWNSKVVDGPDGGQEILSIGMDITIQHNAEMEMERSRSILQATLDSTGDAILVVDTDNIVQAYNKKFLDMWGLSEDDLAKGTDPMIFDEVAMAVDDPDGFRSEVIEIYSTPDRSGEDIVRFKDGRTYHWTVNPQVRNGEVVGRVWNFHEITRMKRTEDALAEREGRLNAIFNSSALGIVVADSSRKILEANEAFQTMVGYTLEELRSKHIEDITSPEDGGSDILALRELSTGQRAYYRTEKRYIRKDGSTIWGRVMVTPLRHTNAGPPSTLATIENIDEQKRVKERLDLTEWQFKALADNFPNGEVIIYDQDRYCLMVGGKGLPPSGLHREDLEGRKIPDVLPKELAPLVGSSCREVLEGGSSVLETAYHGRHFLLLNFPVKDAFGKVLAGMVLTQDITELKMKEERMQSLNRSLRMLSECNQAMVRVKDENELYKEVCRILTSFGGYKLAWIGLAGKGEEKIVHPVAYAGEASGYLDGLRVTYGEEETGQGPTGTAFRTERPNVIPDLWKEERFAPWREKAIENGLRSSIALPMSHRGTIIGALSIYSDRVGAFDDEEMALLTELVNDISYGVSMLRHQAQRLRAEQTLARRGRQLELVTGATQRFNTVLEAEAILDTLGSSAMELTGAQGGMAGRIENGKMVYRKLNRGGTYQTLGLQFTKGQGLTGHVMETLKPYLTNRPEADPYVNQSIRQELGYFNSALAPVVSAKGELLGCFWLQNKPGEGFDDWDLEALSSLAAGAAIALENARMVDELRFRENALEQANRKLSLINRITRHDLLNQLTSLIGFVEMAKMKSTEESVHLMLNKALRSSENIQKHLSFARDYQEIGTTRPSWVSVKGAVSKGSSTLNLGQIVLVTDVNGLEVLADRMLEKVFHNLIDDSIRHGNGTRTIRISCFERGNGLVILYEDDGAGIPLEKKGMLFEMRAGHHGLYMAKEILAITGMGIEEKGEEGRGARFEITVPAGNYRFNH